MRCDIVLPTFNSEEVLPLTLKAIVHQEYDRGWQVGLLVSDDGSTDGTVGCANKYLGGSGWSYEVLTGRHVGVAGARNRAIERSKADVLFFIGADIILRAGSLKAHLRFHQLNPEECLAGLGFVVWDPRIKPTCLMEWMVHGGSQNDYDNLLGRGWADPRKYFYGSNVSVKRSVLLANKFDEEYLNYGWEDLDLGRSLYTAVKLKLRVLQGAVGLHHHYYSTKAIRQRELLVGKNFKLFEEKYPQVGVKKSKNRFHFRVHKIAFFLGFTKVLYWLLTVFEKRRCLPFLYHLATASSFWQGYYDIYPHKKRSYPHSYPQ